MRVFLAHPHALVREGLSALLRQQSDVEVVGKEGCVDAIDVLRGLSVDALVAAGECVGPSLAAAIRGELDGIRMVSVVGRPDAGPVEDLLRAGVNGCVVEDDPPDEFLAAVRHVSGGHAFLSARVTDAVVGDFAAQGTIDPAGSVESRLTTRQLEILVLLAKGKRTREIGEALGISPRTVDVHRGQIRDRLGLRTVAELTTYAYEHGLLS